MDPVAQTLAQQGSGSAEGQGFGNFYVQGRQLNLSQQHLDLQKKAEARAQREQDALLPLQKALIEDKAANVGIELGSVAAEARAGIAAKIILPQVIELYGQFADSLEGYADNALRKKASELMARNPWAFAAGRGAEIKQGIQAFTMQRTKDVMELSHDVSLQDAAEAARNGYNYSDHGDRLAWRKVRAFREAEAIAEKRGQQFDAAQLIPGWFDPDTGHIDPEKLAISLNEMPRSELLQSREEIARLREEFRGLIGRDFAPGPMEKDIKFIDAREAAGLISKEKADRAREVRQGLESKASAAGDWMQRTEVQSLVKTKSKLTDARIEAQNALEDEQSKGSRMFGGTSPSKVKQLQRKVDGWQQKIDNINKEIDTFKVGSPIISHPPAAASPAAPVTLEEKVYIKTPDGKIGTIPRSKLEDALKRGATEYEG